MHISFETMNFKEVRKQRSCFPPFCERRFISVQSELFAVAVSDLHFDRKDDFLLTYLTLSWSDWNLWRLQQSLGEGGMEEIIHYILRRSNPSKDKATTSSHRILQADAALPWERGAYSRGSLSGIFKRWERSWGPLLQVIKSCLCLSCCKLLGPHFSVRVT